MINIEKENNIVKDKMYEMVKEFNVHMVDSYGERLTDNVIFSLIIKDPRMFLILEKYINNEDLYYRIFYHMKENHEKLLNIINKYEISIALEKILGKMFVNHECQYFMSYYPKLSNDSIFGYLVDMNGRNKTYYCKISIYPLHLDLKHLANLIIDNPNTSYQLLNIINEHLVQKNLNECKELDIKIKKHPNSSTAKAILNQIEKSI